MKRRKVIKFLALLQHRCILRLFRMKENMKAYHMHEVDGFDGRKKEKGKNSCDRAYVVHQINFHRHQKK